ncbi:MAG: hypothetical protein EAY75_09905 [Bacteroidetes bacterium]|nr:MAG: hypothetical protein EAY75_09905 [Bacteroidota bacterium]
MLRDDTLALIKKSIRQQVSIDDYSAIYYKVKIADNFTEGGVSYSLNNIPYNDYMMNYPDRIEFFRIYNAALLTSERFNNIEIHFDREMNADATFTWDQAYYDADVEGNKKLKRK